ncbi:MAG: hypothetical protein P1V81_13690 [Planctomycetota bacterium]|nr:hypothetical protein [Planctomycetota bacterium]
MRKLLSQIVPTAVATALVVALPAAASDLKLDGQVNVTKAIGTSLQLDLTGNPGLPALLAVDSSAGPISVLGESIPLGLSPASFFLPGGGTDGAGLYTTSVGIPVIPGIVGLTWYVAGVVLDPLDPNGLDVSNGTSVTFAAVGPGFEVLELAGNALAQRPYFEFVRAINMGSSVEVAIDPLDHPSLVGQTADLFVVDSKDAAGWDANPVLSDVSSGGAETVTFSAAGLAANTFTVDTGTLNGINGAELGVGYDVVIDVDQDGQLSAGDLIDGYGDQAGFYVVHDLTQPGPFAVTETLYSGGTWLDQDTYYPTNIATMGKLPLVVISHGNGHNYQWYDHIGNHLASYGFVVMSHSNDTGPGIDAASLTTLDNTDAILGSQATIAGGVLNGHLDGSRIMWIGHSRGGEGVVRAYDRIVDGTYVPNHFTKEDVRLISSMAPTAYLLPDESTPHDANYHLWVGQSDNDVSGCPVTESRQSYHLLDRALGQSQSISLEGVGHTWFHDNGGFPYASGPCQLGEAQSHLLIKGYILPLAMFHLKDNVPAKDFLTRQYESLRPIGVTFADPCIVANLQFRESPASGKVVIDDFQSNPSTNLASSGAVVSYTITDVAEGRMDDTSFNMDHDPTDPWNGFTQASATDFTKGMVFSYSGGDHDLTFDIAPTQQDWTGFEALSFRACQATRHPLTKSNLGDTIFDVELVDGSGSSSVISIGAFGGGIEEPYQRFGCTNGTGWANEFETIRLSLEGFTVDDAVFDLSDVDKLVFRFGPSHGTPEGRMGLDDIELTTK